MEYMLLPLKRYADFQGRSRRQEFWMFSLFLLIVETVQIFPVMGSLFAAAASGQSQNGEFAATMFSGIGGIMFILLLIFGLAVFIPNLAVQVRRLHDTDRSGWWILLGVVPIVNYIGIIVLFVFYCLEGTKGPNRFGPDPKGENYTDVFR